MVPGFPQRPGQPIGLCPRGSFGNVNGGGNLTRNEYTFLLHIGVLHTEQSISVKANPYEKEDII